MKLDEKTAKALLENYDIQFAKGEHPVAPGTDIAIDGWIDDAGRRVVRARSAAHALERLVPLGDAASEELVDGLRAHHHHAHNAAARQMLKHLFLHVSDMFERERLDRFSLDPVRLHENEYTVVDAAFFAPTAIQVTERRGRHARDRKTFHPSGQQ